MSARVDTPEYRRSYNKGWRYSSSGTGSLDYADSKGYSNDSAWMDGYEDRAAGREKFHRLVCPDHPACEVEVEEDTVEVGRDSFVKRSTTARSTGGRVDLIDVEHPDSYLAPDGDNPDTGKPDRWATICEHGNYVTHETRRTARSFLPAPEAWCESCRIIVDERSAR